MSTSKNHHQPERHIRIRSVRRDPPDLRKLASAVIALAQAQAEAEAQAEHEQTATTTESDGTTSPQKGAA